MTSALRLVRNIWSGVLVKQAPSGVFTAGFTSPRMRVSVWRKAVEGKTGYRPHLPLVVVVRLNDGFDDQDAPMRFHLVAIYSIYT